MIKVEVILLIRLLVLLFMSILFIQSAMDKILNFKANQEWITSYFSKTIFSSQAKLMFVGLTLLESTAGLLSLIGIFNGKNLINSPGFYGLFASSLAFLCLFTGQRIAKDYAGAANIPGYFIVCLIGLLSYLV